MLFTRPSTLLPASAILQHPDPCLLAVDVFECRFYGIDKSVFSGLTNGLHETAPEPYSTILNYKGGPEALKLYISLHPNALFRN